MKESSGKTKKVTKGVRRVRSMRNVVMMVLVCALLLSSATYAWFTLSQTAKITNLTMNVSEDSSLVIAPDTDKAGTGAAGTYGSTLAFGDSEDYNIKGRLKPATMKTTGVIFVPVYDEEQTTVTKVESLADTSLIMGDNADTDKDYYCYKTTFYLKTASEDAVDVRLKAAESTFTDSYTKPSSESGTYVINSKNTDYGAAALRIKLTAGSNSIVYEPQSDYSVSTTLSGAVESAVDNSGASAELIASTDKSKVDGKFATNTGTIEVSNEGTRVTLELWLEGTDADCVNQIMADQIIGQLAFEVVPETTP